LPRQLKRISKGGRNLTWLFSPGESRWSGRRRPPWNNIRGTRRGVPSDNTRLQVCQAPAFSNRYSRVIGRGIAKHVLLPFNWTPVTALINFPTIATYRLHTYAYAYAYVYAFTYPLGQCYGRVLIPLGLGPMWGTRTLQGSTRPGFQEADTALIYYKDYRFPNGIA
jgi:hypothetical protein